MEFPMLPQSPPLRRRSGIYSAERALAGAGLGPVAGVDEAGRGACAGPLVVAAAILPAGRRGRVEGLADSKALTATRREQVYERILERAESHAVVVLSSHEVDRRGVHAANLDGMRMALARLPEPPGFALTDGFGVPGLGTAALGVWRGDRVAACVAAASVLAKVTRDRIMCAMDAQYPGYGFAQHKGYVTAEHRRELAARGPCPEHRRSFVTVSRVSNPGVGQCPDGALRREVVAADGRQGATPVAGEPGQTWTTAQLWEAG
jgi:ribonuclease HII